MFYEFCHQANAEYYILEQGQNLSFPPHIHECFELIIITEGAMSIEVDNQRYTLGKNGAVFIFPNQIHSLHNENSSRHILCVLSPKLINYYSRSVEGKIPLKNQFSIPEEYINKLKENVSTLQLKGILYSICGIFDQNAQYVERQNSVSDKLLFQIFDFVGTNYMKDCSLDELAKEIRYDYAYISKYFKKSIGISYNEYVNRFRINQACYMIRTTNNTILKISEECGYSCLRSFNRNFKNQLNFSPMEYKTKKLDF